MNYEQHRVKKFMEQINAKPGCVKKQAIGTTPAIRDRELRARIVLEEALEFVWACGFRIDGIALGCVPDLIDGGEHVKPNLPEAVDALADIKYVVEGSGVAFGVDLDPIFEEVDRNNCRKIANGHFREDGKFIKPADHQPPDIVELLKRQGWDGVTHEEKT